MKTCKHCNVAKPQDAFPKMSACLDGLSSWCKECHRAAARASSAKNRDRINARNRRPARDLACAECGTVIETTLRRRFCSHTCYHRANANEHRHRKRAAPRSLPFKMRVARLAIYERDAWTCGICHEAVDAALQFPHPLSASLDHVVALRRGGQHSEANVQLAHFACNSRKGDRLVAA